MVLDIEDLDSLPQSASILLKEAGVHKHFAIFGPMGVGKTTLIKELCKQLGVNQVVTSPTFALVNEYAASGGSKVYHFDFYRIKKQEELFDLGYEDYLFGEDYCFIEWPEKAEELIPAHFINLYLEELSSGKRRLNVNFD